MSVDTRSNEDNDFYTTLSLRPENDYLAARTAEIKARRVPWEGYRQAGLISDDDTKKIQAYDQADKGKRSQLLQKDGAALVALFLRLLNTLARVEVVQYLLTLISDVIFVDARNTAIFNALDDPVGPLLRTLTNNDEYIKLKSAHILASLLGYINLRQGRDYYSNFWTTVNEALDAADTLSRDYMLDFVLSLCQSCAGRDELRDAFIAPEYGPLLDRFAVLLPKLKQEQQYQVIFLIWQLSFSEKIASELANKQDVIPALIDIGKSAIKEKVIRVVLSTFRNLVELAPEPTITVLIGAKSHMFFGALEQRKFADEDIGEDLTFVYTRLKEQLVELSTFEEYSAEVRAGRLEWSPVHNSEQFWRQNAERLNEHDHELLRTLSRLLSTSTNPTVLAVASHDIGQYVKCFPSGKAIVDKLGAKQKIMELMTNADPDVRFQALAAVQKYMVGAAAF